MIRENKGAGYGVEDSGPGKWDFVGWGAVGAVAAGGIGVVIWQFRSEIMRGLKKVLLTPTAGKK